MPDVGSGSGPARLDELFARLGIVCERIEHPAVFTTAESERLVPPRRGARAKNLLVEDRSDGRLFMLTVPFRKRSDLAATARALGTGKLRFASEATMLDALGITPGAVSVLALANDTACRVTLVLDRELAQADAIQCHPLVNTATLVVGTTDLLRFLEATEHRPTVIDVPSALAS